MAKPPVKAGVSAKVSNPVPAGVVAAVLTWALTYFIPAFHSGIPPAAEPLIVGASYGIAAWATGYASTHRATAGEVMTALDQARALLQAEGESVVHAGSVASAAGRHAAPAPALPAATIPAPPQP